MAENSTNKLTSKQKRAAEALATGATVERAGLAAKVAERTVYRWLELAEFGAAIRHFQTQASDQHMRALTGELADCRGVMVAARDDKAASWGVRLKAAAMLENSLLRWRESVDFEARLQALEEAIHAQQ